MTQFGAPVSEDPRIRRTQAAIVGAFVRLVLTKRYESISVADIISESGVGRSTFYAHYRNKEDLLRAGLRGHFEVLAGLAGAEDDRHALEQTVAHFWEHRRVGNALFAGSTRQTLTRALAAAIEARLAGNTGGPVHPLPPNLTAAWLAAAQIGLLAEWLSGRASCPPDGVVDALRRIASRAAQTPPAVVESVNAFDPSSSANLRA
jgi:AcrR family transcriptional regulator